MALLVIKQPEVAGFAVFGTFAHLLMVNYDRTGTRRLTQAAILTLFGVITVSLGALISSNTWLAVGGAIGAGFLTVFAKLARGAIAAIRRALLLSFMLAVAVPASPASALPYVAGWLLAGILAQPTLLLVWARLPAVQMERRVTPFENLDCPGSPGSSPWIGDAMAAGMAMGFALLLTRLLNVQHAFWIVLGVLPVLSAEERSATRAFRQEQTGTLIGFLLGAFLVAIIGARQAWYWLTLPFIVFASAYASSRVSFMAGQAAFTVFAVVLFCIAVPEQRHVGIVRVENIAVGGAVSLLVILLRRCVALKSGERSPRAIRGGCAS